MPTFVPRPELKVIIDKAVLDADTRLASAGPELRKELTGSRTLLLEKRPLPEDAGARQKAASSAVTWLRRMPAELVAPGAAPLADLSKMPPQEATQFLARGFDVLALSINALIHADDAPDKSDLDRAIRMSFGDDDIARKLSGELTKPVFPDVDWPKGLAFPDLDKLLALGNIRDHFHTLIDCGRIARNRLQLGSQPFGTIVSLVPDKACAGETIRITFKGFSAVPPDNGWELYLALPMQSGKHASINMRDVQPDLFNPGIWKQDGFVDVALPPGISSGTVGFFLVPPPVGCTEKSLLTAALIVQDTVGRHNPKGAAVFEPIIRFVLDAAQYLRPDGSVAVPALLANRANTLVAGVPEIEYFRMRGGSPVHPGNSITLEWKVRNATSVTIEPHAVVDSENPHELATISVGANEFEGTRTIAVTCTENWRAAYVLTARNASNCGEARSVQPVHSGFRHYRLGVAKQKFDFVIPQGGLRMMGFSDEKQLATDPLDDIFACAFVIAENKPVANAPRVAIVVMDLWGCSQAVKDAVSARVAADPALAAAGYTASNIMISATHTHSAPGGFFHHYLYNLTLGGFDQAVFDHIVEVVTAVIQRAHQNLAPGRLLLAEGNVADCGANRSLDAFLRNPEAAVVPEVDDSMLLLKFTHGTGMPGTVERPIGCLNWFAMHPTNLGMYNSWISGDNKGWAAKHFGTKITGDIVAGFGNAACGDVSGNVARTPDGSILRTLEDGRFKVVFKKPLGHKDDDGEFSKNYGNMQLCGERQAKEAVRLFNTATEEIKGKVDFRYLNLQISNVADAQGNRLTWEAAMGCSFGAGSTEDGDAYAYLGPIPIPSGIVEGITLKDFDDGGFEGAALLAGAGLAGALLAASFGPFGNIILQGLLKDAVQFLIVTQMSKQARAWVMNNVAYLALTALKLTMDEFQDTNIGFTFKVALPAPVFLPPAYQHGHAPKPIMFPCGLAHTSNALHAAQPCPMVPNKVPIQLLRLGQLLVAGIPAEITGVAGRRLKRETLAGFATFGAKIALASYANSYSGYITTEEEYGAQHYEGASTLYGPKTLTAYEQEFRKLGESLRTGSAIAPGDSEQLPGFYRKS